MDTSSEKFNLENMRFEYGTLVNDTTRDDEW